MLCGQRVRYTAAGPVSAQYAYLAGAAYDFKVVTLYGVWAMTSDVSAPTGSHTYQAGLSIPFLARRLPASRVGAYAAVRAYPCDQ
ncbi:hypothetical protein QFZ97_002529 [Paraburkholderia youngii]